MDQSPRAAPHGFSQLATSFIAYPRQGIPRAPLLRLAGVQKKNPNRALPYSARGRPDSFALQKAALTRSLFQQPNLNVRTPNF